MKRFLYIIPIIFAATTLYAQQTQEIKPALLIVDIQYFYFPTATAPGLDGAVEAAAAASEVLRIFRSSSLPVIHIKHDAAQGADIYPDVLPVDGEKVITKKSVNSFLNTDLSEYLKGKGINRLIIIGMQTHMCLEAAVRAAADSGFDCIVVSNACATRDLKFGETIVKAADVQASTFESLVYGRYAKIVTLTEFKSATEKYLK